MTFEQQRQDYDEALRWVSESMAATMPAQLGDPTPCARYDVRLLLGHLIGTAQRALATAEQMPAGGIPHVVTDVADADLTDTYAGLAEQIGPAWARLDATDPVTAPWGRCTALEAVRGFTIETLVHGWDIAVATGRATDVCDHVAQRCLPFAAAMIPDRLRGIMYEPPVITNPAAPATERLAHLLGHQRASTTADS